MSLSTARRLWFARCDGQARRLEVDQPTTDESQDGVVVDEQPKGGTKAPDGSDVTVSIGRYSPTG